MTVLKKGMIFLILLALTVVLPAGTHAPRPRLMAPPDHISITGTLYRPGQERGEAREYTLFVGDLKWIYRIEEVKDVGTTYVAAWTLISRIFPPVLYVRASRDLVGLLENPDLAGKNVNITGYLYSGDRILQVTEVKVYG